MAIALANKLGTTNTTSNVTTLSLTVGATTTARNRVIVAVLWANQDLTTTVTDSQGNAYILDGHAHSPAAQAFASVFSARADTALTSGTDTITVKWSGGSAGNPIIFAYEVSGLANFAPMDLSASGSGSNTAATASITTTQANEFIFGLIGYGSGTFTVSSPSQTQLDFLHSSTVSLETQYAIKAATGTYTFSGTISSITNWVDLIVGYADTANSTTNQPSNSTAPVITGSGVLGMQLTCSQGSWTNTPTAYAYQWKRDGTNITGATLAHYLVTTSDIGHVLSCVVTASNKYAGVAATASNTVTPAVKTIQAGMGI